MGRPSHDSLSLSLPTFLTTLLKLQHLRALVGTDIVCCESKFVESDPAASRLLREHTSFRMVSMEEAVAEGRERPFDVVLDCGGELAGRVLPRVGTVELTQTGEAAYRALGVLEGYCVVSVDASRVKRIEDRLGSADGFMRALRLLSDFDGECEGEKRVCVVGYGKVGVGICDQLARRGAVPVVIDVSEGPLRRAAAAGLAAVDGGDSGAVRRELARAWGVVTCTGARHAMREYCEGDVAATAVLCNMGVEDEYGDGFTADRVLCGKRAVNFALEEPTLFEYLDPAFVASQEAIPLLAGLERGRVHPLPPPLDARVIADWEAAHNRLLAQHDECNQCCNCSLHGFHCTTRCTSKEWSASRPWFSAVILPARPA